MKLSQGSLPTVWKLIRQKYSIPGINKTIRFTKLKSLEEKSPYLKNPPIGKTLIADLYVPHYRGENPQT